MTAGNCPNGHQTTAGAKFCPECGAAIPPPTPPPAATPLAAAPQHPPVYVRPVPGNAEQRKQKRHGPLFWIVTSAGGLLVFLFVHGAIMTAVGGKNSSSPPSAAPATPATTTAPAQKRDKQKPPKPPAPPSRFQQLLPAGLTVKQAAGPLCASVQATITNWQTAAAGREATIKGANSTAYTAAALRDQPGTGWLRAQTQVAFETAVRNKTGARLKAVARRGDARYVDQAMVLRFRSAALAACGLSTNYHTTDVALSQLDSDSGELLGLAAAKPWYPPGYNQYSSNIAFKWDNNVTKCADSSDLAGEICWGMLVVTKNGCSNLYAELNILQGQTVVDYTNDTLDGLEPGQVGELGFDAFEQAGVDYTGQLKTVTCY